MRLVWFLYATMGVVWTKLALKDLSSMQVQEEAVAIATAFQVGVGLLLLNVSATTGLAEERARSSLDVLLSTPLSTFTILAGKWWGAFRLVGRVFVWPVLLAGLLVANGGSWFDYMLLLGLTLAYGAEITSLGLASATWFSRLGQAIAFCVSAYVVFSIGWVLLIVFTGRADRSMVAPLMGSPLAGTPITTVAVAEAGRNTSDNAHSAIVIGAILWTAISSAVAGVLFVATLATFDHCLGRMPEKRVEREALDVER
jgi:ABC-type transport system involved in multi-copper enzyme maturation permease subunit